MKDNKIVFHYEANAVINPTDPIFYHKMMLTQDNYIKVNYKDLTAPHWPKTIHVYVRVIEISDRARPESKTHNRYTIRVVHDTLTTDTDSNNIFLNTNLTMTRNIVPDPVDDKSRFVFFKVGWSPALKHVFVKPKLMIDGMSPTVYKSLYDFMTDVYMDFSMQKFTGHKSSSAMFTISQDDSDPTKWAIQEAVYAIPLSRNEKHNANCYEAFQIHKSPNDDEHSSSKFGLSDMIAKYSIPLAVHRSKEFDQAEVSVLLEQGEDCAERLHALAEKNLQITRTVDVDTHEHKGMIVSKPTKPKFSLTQLNDFPDDPKPKEIFFHSVDELLESIDQDEKAAQMKLHENETKVGNPIPPVHVLEGISCEPESPFDEFGLPIVQGNPTPFLQSNRLIKLLLKNAVNELEGQVVSPELIIKFADRIKDVIYHIG